MKSVLGRRTRAVRAEGPCPREFQEVTLSRVGCKATARAQPRKSADKQRTREKPREAGSPEIILRIKRLGREREGKESGRVVLSIRSIVFLVYITAIT